MKITIECEPKEIAAIATQLQQQPITAIQTCPQCSQIHLPADVCPYCGFDYKGGIKMESKTTENKNPGMYEIRWGYIFPHIFDIKRRDKFDALVREKGLTTEDLRLIALVVTYEKVNLELTSNPL